MNVTLTISITDLNPAKDGQLDEVMTSAVYALESLGPGWKHVSTCTDVGKLEITFRRMNTG